MMSLRVMTNAMRMRVRSVCHEVASWSGAYAGPHTRAASAGRTSRYETQRLFDHVRQEREPQTRRQPDHEHGHGRRDDEAAAENDERTTRRPLAAGLRSGRRSATSVAERASAGACAVANVRHDMSTRCKARCAMSKKFVMTAARTPKATPRMPHQWPMNAPLDDRRRVRALAPRPSVHRAGRAGEGVAELVARPEEHSEHHDAERGLEGHPRRSEEHPNRLVAQHCDDDAGGEGQECEDSAAVPKGGAQLLAIVLHARQRGKQHFVRDLSEEIRGKRHHGVRAPIETERVGTERAADDEIVALHRDPVPDSAEELAAAVRHEILHRLTRETRSPRVRDNDPQQHRVDDGLTHLAVDERPRTPPPRRQRHRDDRVARVARELDHRERSELHSPSQQEVSDGQASYHERQAAHAYERCECGQPKERGDRGSAERDARPKPRSTAAR